MKLFTMKLFAMKLFAMKCFAIKLFNIQPIVLIFKKIFGLNFKPIFELHFELSQVDCCTSVICSHGRPCECTRCSYFQFSYVGLY